MTSNLLNNKCPIVPRIYCEKSHIEDQKRHPKIAKKRIVQNIKKKHNQPVIQNLTPEVKNQKPKIPGEHHEKQSTPSSTKSNTINHNHSQNPTTTATTTTTNKTQQPTNHIN